ncbi:hypothetical protein MPTK1_6g07900 [Marchantia polymorpha subsp. ruderalis]|uniref:Uncharacterized protein n=2 Tax=Marchantia polymorpha TaxID=3197 RepID=A0AAF6BPP5_MARPO|nr:hypothetical protein MARPO_0053s0103 [Marchantia polymorpha]BBN13979.1 hypothetical protein Mp_6g07900 [Marchantia polymorpha subsp. ruderalis]|eukprot:PTQ38180.1 hypothetical protein MARPO_0053s0103 [Marchantia polymorpha]
MAARSRGLVFFGQRLLISSRGGSSSVVASCSASDLGCKRYCSGPSWEDSADGEMDMSPSRRLEQALQEIRIQKAAPDWLPLFPGGSFWIHPDQIAKEPSKPSGPLLEPASEREIFAMVAPMGWPSSSSVDDALCPEPEGGY